MLVLERAEIEQVADAGEPAPRAGRSGRSALPVVAMAAGVVLVAAALVVVQLASPTPAPASTELTVGGPADVTIQTATYEPGQTSGWHVHTGMHAVLVLSGTVTFYDGQCQGRTYGPGETYVGGQETHVVRNETAEPAQLAVTYLFPVGRPHTTFHVDSPAPAGCDAPAD